MIQNTQQRPSRCADAGTYKAIDKSRSDLVVLNYMARRVHVTLHTIEQQLDSATLPLRYTLEERHNRTHRLVIFNPHELLLNKTLSFVGFVSGRQKTIDTGTIDELLRIDSKIVSELVTIPGLRAYSSLELRADRWYNLVLLDANGTEAKSHLTGSATHKYAAHQLAPRYYEWVRLHSGTIDGGLAGRLFALQTTRYYRFPGGLQGIAQRFVP